MPWSLPINKGLWQTVIASHRPQACMQWNDKSMEEQHAPKRHLHPVSASSGKHSWFLGGLIILTPQLLTWWIFCVAGTCSNNFTRWTSQIFTRTLGPMRSSQSWGEPRAEEGGARGQWLGGKGQAGLSSTSPPGAPCARLWKSEMLQSTENYSGSYSQHRWSPSMAFWQWTHSQDVLLLSLKRLHLSIKKKKKQKDEKRVSNYINTKFDTDLHSPAQKCH